MNKRNLKIVSCAMIVSLLAQYVAGTTAALAGPVIPSHVVRLNLTGYRPKIVVGHHAPFIAGRRIAGPSMLARPPLPSAFYPDPRAMSATASQGESGRVTVRKLSALRESPNVSPTAWPTATPFPTPTPSPTATPAGGPTPPSGGNSVSSKAGRKPWWTIIRDRIGGVGDYGVEVSQGNLMVQATDMDIPNAGASFNLTRTYNSFSQHDSSGTDGSAPSIYGQDWTNTWDAHIAFSGNNNIVVWDGLGTAYNYTADVNHPGNWLPQNGIVDQLQFDGGNGYYWIHPDGTEHYFYAPNQQSAYQAFSGRLYAFYGRNRHTSIYFQYSFNPDASSSNNITQISAIAQDSRQVQLQFTKWGSYNELTTLVWPDGTQVAYHYDTATGHLTQVDEPGNGTTSVVSHAYSYDSSTGKLTDVENPNFFMASQNAPGTDLHFSYNANAKLTGVAYIGTVNLQPADGTAANLDPSAAIGNVTYRQITVSYGNGTTTTLSDTDGHTIALTHDSSEEVTSIAANTGDPSSGVGSLSMTLNWFPDSDVRSHHVSSMVDARGAETDFAYDNSGDLLGVGRPSVPTSSGNVRPTTWMSYDAFHNVTAICDPNYSDSHGLDWGSVPTPAPNASPTPCPASSGTTQTQYQFPVDGNGYAYEPFGQKKTVTDATGYQWSFGYDPSSQGGQDLGLPTSVTGASFTMGSGNVSPITQAVYDLSGNVLCMQRGVGHWWTAQYDAVGRIVGLGDADDYVVNGSACGKSQGQYADAQHFTYFVDGLLAGRQTASQFAAGVTGQSFQYDADGNATTEARWINGTQYASTARFYDGADRLVEVKEPPDTANDLYSYPWLTRYLYDLSGNGVGGSTTFLGSTVTAHGNLYKMQRYLAVPVQDGDASPTPAPAWMDVSAMAHDELNRVTDHLTVPAGQTTGVVDNSDQYDAPNNIATNNAGLISVDHYGGNYLFDAMGRLSQLTYFQPSGPHAPGVNPGSLNFTYDPAGGVKTACCGIGVNPLGTTSYSYDTDERVITVAEPTATPLVFNTPIPTDALTYSNQYYPNGWTKNVAYSGNNGSGSYSYTYYDDGRVSNATLSTGTQSYSLSYVYTPAGRLQTKTDSIRASNTTTTWGYDTFGRLLSLTIPHHAYTAIGYDRQDRIAQFTANSAQKTLLYSSRGELLGEGAGATPKPTFKSADGVLYPLDQQECFPYGPPNLGLQDCGQVVTNFDARSGAPLGNTWTPAPTHGPTPPPAQNNIFQYDTANQQIGETLNGVQQWGADYYWNGLLYSQGLGISSTYTYDSSGRLAMRTNCRVTCATSDTELLHWGSGPLIATSNALGTVDDVKFGFDADMASQDTNYTGMTFWDRDPLGYVAEGDNASAGGTSAATSAWADVNPYNPCSPTALATPSPNYEGPASFSNNGGARPACSAGSNLFFEPRTDMITDGANIMQGSRAFEPATAAWNAPDPAADLSGNPMSDMAYAYDFNDPAGYLDPTGSFPQCKQLLSYDGPIGVETCYDNPGDPSNPPQITPDDGGFFGSISGFTGSVGGSACLDGTAGVIAAGAAGSICGGVGGFHHPGCTTVGLTGGGGAFANIPGVVALNAPGNTPPGRGLADGVYGGFSWNFWGSNAGDVSNLHGTFNQLNVDVGIGVDISLSFAWVGSTWIASVGGGGGNGVAFSAYRTYTFLTGGFHC